MHPRPPQIWTHKHARIVGRHSPHNNNKNPSARLRPAARHIMPSRSLGRDSARRSHVITAAGASSQITRSLRTPPEKSCALLPLLSTPPPPTSRRPSTFPPPSLSPSLAVCSISLPSLRPTPPHSSRTPTLPPSQGRTYTPRERDSPDIPFAVEAPIAFPHVCSTC